MTIYTRNEAARIVELFEDVLIENGIRIPSPDDEQRDEDNDAPLYGQTYADLLDDVERYLVQFLNRHAKAREVRVGVFGP